MKGKIINVSSYTKVNIKIQLYVALVVMLMSAQLIAYISYTLDPGALVVYQGNFWIRGLYGLVFSLIIATIIFVVPVKIINYILVVLGRYKNFLLLVTIATLAFLLTPYAPSRYGARRWLWGIQISDIAKFVVLILVVFSLNDIWNNWKKQNIHFGYIPVSELILSVITIIVYISSFFLDKVLAVSLVLTTMIIYVSAIIYIETLLSGKEFFNMSILFALVFILILFEPDISTSSLFALWFLFMLMIWYGKRGLIISVVVTLGIFVMANLIKHTPLETTLPTWFSHAIYRLQVWSDPFVDPNGISYHMVKNFLAVFKGGLLGNYPVNMLYIPPVPWSDAILPFIAAYMGVIFEVLLIALWISWGLFFLISGIRIKGLNGMYVTGFALWFLLQLMFNMLSTYDIFPPTGMSVPYLSWGRTGLVIFTIMNSISAVFVSENIIYDRRIKSIYTGRNVGDSINS